MAALLFLLLVIAIATELDRFEHKRGNHNDYGNDLEVRHDLTSSTFVFGGEKPSASVSFLPEAQGLHCYYSIAARARQIMFSNVFNFFVPLSEKTGDFRKIAELRGKSQISMIYIGYAYIYNRRSGW